MSDPQQPDIQDEISQSTISKDIYCPGCRYHLFGIISDRCPECGYSLSYLTCETSSIPWENRREIGRVKAYCQTVWFMFFRRQRFAEQYAKSVNYRDSRKFQLITILLVFIPVAIVMLIFSDDYFSVPLQPYIPYTAVTHLHVLEFAYHEGWPVVLLFGCVFLYLFTITGVTSYFFHPKVLSNRLQNNAIALSYYTCSALPVLIVSIITIGGLYWYGESSTWYGSSIIIILIVITIVIFIKWWGSAPLLHRLIIPQRSRRLIITIAQPLLWLLLGGLILVVLPAFVIVIPIVFSSLN